ncbi:MAG: protoglobin domain-containing protein, partial [Nitrospiria bacterium]
MSRSSGPPDWDSLRSKASFQDLSCDISFIHRLQPIIDVNTDSLLNKCSHYLVQLFPEAEIVARIKVLQKTYLENLCHAKNSSLRIHALVQQIELSRQWATEGHHHLLSLITPLILAQFKLDPSEQESILSKTNKVFMADLSKALETYYVNACESCEYRVETLQKHLDHQKVRLSDSKKRFHSIFENVSSALCTYRRSGEVFRWNKPFETLLNLKENEIKGEKLFELITREEGSPRIRDAIRAVFQGKELTDIQWKIKSPMG